MSIEPFLYSPALSECASCGEHIALRRGVGTVALDIPGRPQMSYSLCNTCAPRLDSRNPYFMQRLGQRLIKRAGELGGAR